MLELDKKLFHLFNQTWANPVFDLFFPFWTDVQKTVVGYLIIITILLALAFKKNWRAIFIMVMCSLGMFLADLKNSRLLKPLFERARPTDVILRTAEQGSYSFPSSHAVDVFFMATFMSLFYPRLRWPLFLIAVLTSFSRVYCGVHYPGDILGGAIMGSLLGYLFYQFINKLMKTKIKFLSCLLLLAVSLPSFAKLEDPTGGKPFFPWAWNEQLKPTIIKGFDKTGLIIIGSASVSVLAVHQYDGKIFDFSKDGGNLLMSEDTAQKFGKLGNGMAGFILVGTQYYFDQENGLKTFRALLLTTVAHITLAALVQRERPGNRSDFLPFPSSFPSGHTSSAFALAGSLAYSYGWAGAIPGYLAASAIALSRVKENRHWASDIVGGAFLGTFWARASFAQEPVDKEAFLIVPIPVYDGAMISAMKEF